MGKHVGVGVTEKTLRMGDLHASQDQLAVGRKGMHVIAMADAKGSYHVCAHCSWASP